MKELHSSLSFIFPRCRWFYLRFVLPPPLRRSRLIAPRLSPRNSPKNFPYAAAHAIQPPKAASIPHIYFIPNNPKQPPNPTVAMAPSRTRTVKNKHAAPKSSDSGGGRKSSTGGVSKPRKPGKPGPVSAVQLKEKNRAALLKKPKKKTYTDEELGIPKLNMITPVGVTKPKGKKKGKVFVDDKVGTGTLLNSHAQLEPLY